MRRRVERRGDLVGRMAEVTAARLGSAEFLLIMSVVIVAWFIVNVVREFDPHYFLLNLLFSTMASYAAPLILLAQNRGAALDRIQLEDDRAINRQAKSDMAYLGIQIQQLRSSLSDLPKRDHVRTDVEILSNDLRRAFRAHRARRHVTP